MLMSTARTADLSTTQKQKPLQLLNQEDDKFFSRLISKESSMANPSFRVYYGGVAGSVPFIWESQPGTPKHIKALFSESSLPPLTPPPSSFRSTPSRATNFDGKEKPIKELLNPGNLFRRILVKINVVGRSPSSRSMLVPVKPMVYHQRRRFSSQGSSFDSVIIADDVYDEEHVVSPRSSYLCFRFGRRNNRW